MFEGDSPQTIADVARLDARVRQRLSAPAAKVARGGRATSELASLIWICLLCGCCTYAFASLFFEVLREEWKRSRRSEGDGLEEGEEGG